MHRQVCNAMWPSDFIMAFCMLEILLLYPLSGIALTEENIQRNYIVSNVFVAVTGDSQAVAQRHALMKAEIKSIKQLLERLTIPADHALLPAQISRHVTRDLVQDITIEEEKNTNNHYMAKMSIHFRWEAVQTYLKALGVSYIVPSIRPILIVPLLQPSTAALPYLWKKDNPWLLSWQKQMHVNRLISIIVPSRNPREQAFLFPEPPVAGDTVILKTLIRHWYAVESAFMVQVFFMNAGENNQQKVVHMQSFQLDDMGAPLVKRIICYPDESLAAMLDRAAQTVMNRLETDWRRQNTIWVLTGPEQG